MKQLGIRFCKNCNNIIKIYHKKRLTQKDVFCNKECRSIYTNIKNKNVKCSVCGKMFHLKPSRIKRVKYGITCSKKCSNEYKKNILCGDTNPNFKYNRDLSFIYDLTHDGAYILGLIWSDGHLRDNTISIFQKGEYSGYLLSRISHMVYGIDLSYKHKSVYTLNINDKKLVDYIISLGGIQKGKKSSIIDMPNIPSEFIWSFICGYFDGDGGFKYDYRYPQIKITSNSNKMLMSISKYWNVEYNDGTYIDAYGIKALDICGKMYENVSLYHKHKYEYYLSMLNYEKRSGEFYVDNIKVKKNNKNAILPIKNRVTDSGYDLHIISYEDKGNNIYLCDTGICIEPPLGYYFDMIGRSSLPKNNFHFLGGVGVIDRGYTGSIKVMLQQLDSSIELPKLPFKCVQIIPREIKHFGIIEVDELEDTERGQTGFGSTGR